MKCFSGELARFVFLDSFGVEGCDMPESLLKSLSGIERRWDCESS